MKVWCQTSQTTTIKGMWRLSMIDCNTHTNHSLSKGKFHRMEACWLKPQKGQKSLTYVSGSIIKSDIHKNNGFLIIILIMMVEISWVLLTANANSQLNKKLALGFPHATSIWRNNIILESFEQRMIGQQTPFALNWLSETKTSSFGIWYCHLYPSQSVLLTFSLSFQAKLWQWQ